jgi:hypothetical protein
MPISPVPATVESLATRLASAFLLIRDYGVGSRSTSKDGYALYLQLMGRKQEQNVNAVIGMLEVGEIGMICSVGYQLVDDSGNIIPRNDDDSIESSVSYVDGGRVAGRLNNITDENMRFKEPQVDANANQPYSGYNGYVPTQG